MVNLGQYYSIWQEAVVLAWPVVLNHIFTTAMRTTDMLLMGFFGPAAVTAVGLGDVWERLVLRVGLGLGTGSISLISQETGVEEVGRGAGSSDEVLTQVLITGVIISLPFMVIGLFFSDFLIAILGAAPEVIQLGAEYLMIILAAAPFRLITLISDRSLQGTGDTRTPMVVNVISNVVNIVLSVGLALGTGPFPEIGVVGVGWGTFVAKMVAALMYLGIFLLSYSHLSLSLPDEGWDLIIVKQLFKISLPKILQGGYQSLITFPFNALVLLFGTEAAAAYHIARRVHQQLVAPLHRAYGTVTTIMTGKALGMDKPFESKKITDAMLWLTAITITLGGIVLFIGAPVLTGFFTDDSITLRYSINFLRALGIGAPILTLYGVLSGLLSSAGDTRTPFYGLVMSQTVFKLGLSYLLAVPVGLGLPGIFIGMVLDFIARAGWVARRYLSGDWAKEARVMIDERHKG
ncbi:MAG: MATE family efflux transporter [Bacillota bacterium]